MSNLNNIPGVTNNVLFTFENLFYIHNHALEIRNQIHDNCVYCKLNESARLNRLSY